MFMKLLLALLILCFLQNCSKKNVVIFNKISEIKTYKLQTPPINTWEKKFERTYQGTIYRNEKMLDWVSHSLRIIHKGISTIN